MMMKPYQKNKPIQKKEKGQIIVILALVFIGLVAIVGLAVDLGYYYVSYSRLRRAVDGAALAATSQFREGYTIPGLTEAAQEFLQLNSVGALGTDPNTLFVSVQTCNNAAGDPELCTTPPRKMVRVTVTQRVPLYFLSVVGLHEVPITVSSVSEAATVDLVLLIDSSPSMALGNHGQEVDPVQCNAGHNCHPFEEIKAAAKTLVDTLFPGYDRVGIVTFSRFPKVDLPFTDLPGNVATKIDSLKVYEGEGKCPWSTEGSPTSPYVNPDDLFEGPCRLYQPTTPGTDSAPGLIYGPSGMDCLNWVNNQDPRGCMSTNSGGGLKVAGKMFLGIYPAGHTYAVPLIRETALRVVIWLTDGATNAGFGFDGRNVDGYDNQILVGTDPINNSICPGYTWQIPQPPATGPGDYRLCSDLDARPTLAQIAADPTNKYIFGRHPPDPLYTAIDDQLYDADDYARDMVEIVTDPLTGQGAMMFTIGLGPLITDPTRNETTYERDNGRPPPGETLLKFAAEKGGGIYYASPTSAELNAIFLAIANKIATRLSR
jgi:Flp pilus assembly protein TadG